MGVRAYWLLAALAGSLAINGHAADGWSVEGQNGVLQVHGFLTENACRLDMNSAWQDVAMGVTETRMLTWPGERGESVEVELRLRDCLRVESRNRDVTQQTLVWSPYQPAVSARLIAVADPNNPELVKVKGAKGFGLRLQDGRGRIIVPGERQSPQLVSPTQDSLRYRITPERTTAMLEAGYYQARIDVQLSYE